MNNEILEEEQYRMGSQNEAWKGFMGGGGKREGWWKDVEEESGGEDRGVNRKAGKGWRG